MPIHFSKIKELIGTSIICSHFTNSTIYRVGGDEFAAILEGIDFQNREQLLSDFDREMDEAVKQGKIVIAAGCSVYEPKRDDTLHTVFERADEYMYERKKTLKSAAAEE